MFAATYSRRARLAVLASGFAFALGSASVLAQPGPGAGGPGFGGPGMHGPHAGMGYGGGDPLAGVISRYKSELALTGPQQQQWDSAVALAKQARETGRGYRDQVHTVMQAELSKPEPDLAAVAAAADAAQAQGQALHKQVRDAWLALYATFSPAQKAVVRDALATRMRKMDERRAAWGRG